MVVVTSSSTSSKPKRPPLLPSDRLNDVVSSRRPKSREVNSRYLSTTSSNSTSSSSSSSSTFSTRRFPSPSTPGLSPRSASCERRRPSTSMSMSTSQAAKLLVNSTRSLSVSFQKGKGTPERKRNLAMETPIRPLEHQQPWPGRSRSMSSSLGRSIDLGSEGKVVRPLQRSLISNCNDLLRTCVGRDEIVKGVAEADTESLLSECNSGSQDSSNTSLGGRRSNVVPASRSRHAAASEPCSPMVRNNAIKGTVPCKLITPKLVSDSPGVAVTPRGTVSSRGFSSPLRGSVRPSSPSKLANSAAFEKRPPSRGMTSPSRVRNVTNQGFSTPSSLNFGSDVRRIKVGDNRLGDAHFLRLVHNRHLQWRFVNARSEASLSSRKVNAERSLYNAWKKTLELRGTVSSKRKELQWLRLKFNLESILKGQMLCLEEWAMMEMDHCSSLSGAAESLKGSIIRLPVIGGARAGIQDLKDAICSAADVMQAMASSICSLLPKIEEANLLVADVACLTSKEHALLSECKDILSTLAAMQVKDCSLRAHVLQLKHTPSNLAVKA